MLILSDLGRLHSYPQRAASRWLAISRILQRKHCRVVVLLPYAREAADHRFKSCFQLLSWEQKTITEDLAQTTRHSAIDKLFTALSPCIRIEPALMRAMRLTMQKCSQSWQLSAATESYCWQHEAIQEPHRVAASWAIHKRKAYLNAFESLSEDEKQTALNTLRQWRGTLSEKIWYEEIISLDPQSQQLDCIKADVQQAQNYFLQLSQDVQQNAFLTQNINTQSWFKRLYYRLPTECLQSSSSLQRISERVFQEDETFNRQWLNPQKLPQSNQPIQQAVLYQQGLQLYLKSYTPFDLPQQGYSPLALIKLRRDYVQLLSEDQILGELSLNQPQGMNISTIKQLTLISDEESLQLQTLAYSEGLEKGRDSYGLYADINFFGITQRFRYIEPGTFMMGSPSDELERDDDEDYHQVTLTQGYWLADTACTQALWQAVMGENPAEFSENPQNPVEQVSWLDIQTFLQQINQQSTDYQLQLPSEAQWEYACRAGTTTPFSFGDTISPEQVNYNGTKPYANAKTGEYREKTVAVKSLPVNPWGLYEMHGNVWERCQDEWNENLGLEVMIDPVNDSTSERVNRVVRGGSWSYYGRNVRSAIRNGYWPDLRYYYGGFRLSLGHELLPDGVSRSEKNRLESDQAKHDPARRGAVQGHDLIGRGSTRKIKK